MVLRCCTPMWVPRHTLRRAWKSENGAYRASQGSGVASPKIWEPKMFDFRRATVFCMGCRFLKHKMTRAAKNPPVSEGCNQLILSGRNDCKLLYLTTKHVFEDFGGGAIARFPPWLRACRQYPRVYALAAGVKRNFWPTIVCQLFCFSE